MNLKSNPLVRLFTSFGLSVFCLVYLLGLTYFGTLYQVKHGLKDAQQVFFDSWFIYGILPGGQLVMSVLFVNLIAGGILSLRKSWRRIGILITHLGMVVMLVAGWVKYYQSDDGYMRLYEGQSADHFVSYYEWELAISERLGAGVLKEYVTAGDHFAYRRPDAVTTISNPALPFDVQLTGFQSNARVVRADQTTPTARVLGGLFLQALPRELNAEHNAAGAYVSVRHKTDSRAQVQEAILWGGQQQVELPLWVVEVEGRRFALELRHKTFPMPFGLHLDKFIKEDHPGTTMAAAYMSDVTKIEGDDLQGLRIQMNEPLRHKGHVVFQSGYGPQDPEPGEPLYSVFSVVRNPSDQWPLWSCIIVGFGMLLHFGIKLFRFFLMREMRALQAGQVKA